MIEVFYLTFFFSAGILLGNGLINLTHLTLSTLTRFVANLLMGISVLTIIIFYQSYLFPFSKIAILGTLMISLLIGIFLTIRGKHVGKNIQKIKINHQLVKLLIFIIFWVLLFWLIWTKILVVERDGWYSSCTNCWGDWSAHFTYTSSFAYGNNFPPQLPILAGQPFRYPFLIDFLSAILVKLNVSLPVAMVVPGFIFSVTLVLTLYSLGKEISGKISVASYAVWLFLFNGGLGFWWFFKDMREEGLVAMIKNLPREYTHLSEVANIQWVNVITSQLIPQRGFLLGFPLALLVYLFFWRYLKTGKINFLKLAGLMTALLPLIHAHSFLAVNIIAILLAFYHLLKQKEKFLVLKNWANYFLPVILLGLTQTIHFYGPFLGQSSFGKWQPGWMANKAGSNLVTFWIMNLGLMLPLILVGWWLVSKRFKVFSLSFGGLFILANLWLFQPWDWDNTKIFIHWYVIAVILAAVALDFLIKSRRLALKFLGILFFLLAIFSGSLDVGRLLQYQAHRYRFWDNQQLVLAEWVKKNTSAKAVFLTATNHNHWLPALTGRKIVLGYAGWLWTYGLDYKQREIDIIKIFKGEPGTQELLPKYQINYVVLGPDELSQKQGQINQQFWAENFPVFLDTNGYKIYKIN